MALVTHAIHAIVAGVVAQLVECHTGMHSPRVPIPALQKHDVTSHVTGGADRGQEVQCHPLLHRASRLSLGYMRPSLELDLV